MSTRPGSQPQSQPSATERVEERLARVPWAQSLTEVPLASKFFAELLPKMTFPETTREVLEAFSGVDVKAEELAQILERNPYYDYQFRCFIESMGKRENTPSVGATVVLLGMQRSRDLV